MQIIDLPAPRVNANEDEVLIVQIAVQPGSTIRKGDLLFVVETTKAANEVLSPVGGKVEKIHVATDQFVKVGAVLASIATEETMTVAAVAQDAAETSGGEKRISAKAAKLARDRGIDIADIRASGTTITVEDVERHSAAAVQRNTGKLPARKAEGGDAVILGAGGHGVTVADTLEGSAYKVIGYLDSIHPVGAEIFDGVKVVASDREGAAIRKSGTAFAFIGVGGTTSNTARKQVFERLLADGFTLPPAISVQASVSRSAVIGEGSVVLAGAVVGPNVTIGRNCIINHNVTICHDSVIGDHVHLTPGATIAGNCRIGDSSTIGMCATVLNTVKVGRDCLVHNSTSVIADLPDQSELNAKGQRSHRRI